MREAIKILRRELVFCTRLGELMEELSSVLKERASGRDVSLIVKKLEQVLSEGAKLEAEQKSFLKSVKQESLQGYLEGQPVSVEKDMALRLLAQVKDQQAQLRQKSETSHVLLERSEKFVDFHMNVLSRTRANPTYGPPGTGGAAPRERRMFDQNV